MKISIADRIAVAFIIAATLLAAGGWVCALAVERRAEHFIQTTCREPSPEFRAAVAAGEAAEADDSDNLHVARGQ